MCSLSITCCVIVNSSLPPFIPVFFHPFLPIPPFLPLSSSPPLLPSQAVDIRHIADKFPEKNGGLKDLFEKGPQDRFFLVKFWVRWIHFACKELQKPVACISKVLLYCIGGHQYCTTGRSQCFLWCHYTVSITNA